MTEIRSQRSKVSKNSALGAMLFALSFLCVVLLALCVSAHAQQATKVPRIGFLTGGSPSTNSVLIDAFRQALPDLGYIEGQNITIEHRYAEGKLERFPELARELVELKVDIIFANSTPATQAAKNATKTIPIIGTGTDLVGTGLIASFAHPGGNVTGFSNVNDALGGKQLELIKEAFPKVSRVAVLWHPANAGNALWVEKMKVAADALRIRLQSLEVRGPKDFEAAFLAMKKEHASALSVLQNAATQAYQAGILEFAAKAKLAAIYPDSEWVNAGGLMSYGSTRTEVYRRAATYVDKILKGRTPADLPVEQPTKFELIINLKTAKQLGLTIPQTVLYQADRVIK